MLKYVDVHSHILHRLDDGPEHMETSLKMLEEEFRQNVDTVILTPHFKDFDNISINEFIEKRNQRARELREYAQKEGVQIPDFRLGAEVLLNCNLAEIDDIEKLAIEGTRYILIEMPYTARYDWMFDSIYALIAQKNLIPVIAHIERYSQVDKKKIDKLASMDLYFQINGEAILDKATRRAVFKMIRNDTIHLIGSDCHNQNNRVPNLEKAYDLIREKISGEFAHYLNANGHLLLDDEYIEKYASNYYQETPVKWFRRMFR